MPRDRNEVPVLYCRQLNNFCRCVLKNPWLKVLPVLNDDATLSSITSQSKERVTEGMNQPTNICTSAIFHSLKSNATLDMANWQRQQRMALPFLCLACASFAFPFGPVAVRYRNTRWLSTKTTTMHQLCRNSSTRRDFDKRTQFAVQMVDNSDDGSAPDPSILFLSAQGDKIQQIVFVAAFAALAVGTNLFIQLWHGPGLALLGNEGYSNIRETIFPLVFGSIFAIVGILHFVFVENFARIVPPFGTWGGLWQVPAPFHEKLGITYEEYHSYWTGIAEFVGGFWLLAGALGFAPSTELPAFLLFVLTVGVTPANLYMFTHDANPGGAVPRLAYPAGHIARFLLQCGLLSNFWIMAHHS